MQTKSNTQDSNTASHEQGVNATSGELIKSTIGAALVAGAILLFAWLPAEHGIDPTGVGHLLGLTEMGHIKEQLHEQADADVAAAMVVASTAANATTTTQVQPTAQAQSMGLSNAEITKKLDNIQLQLDAIAQKVDETSQAVGAQSGTTSSAENTQALPAWKDEVEYTLEPGLGIEVKLKMNKGAVAEFEWTANGAVLNHDTHGDGSGESISYEKGRSVAEQAGQLVAAFTGNHGWYWRNRTNEDVVVTMRARGDYNGMVLPEEDDF